MGLRAPGRLGVAVALLAVLSACAGRSTDADGPVQSTSGPGSSTSMVESTGSAPVVPATIRSADIAPAATTAAGGDGDLWPNCWAPDDTIYAANGDGGGFSGAFSDIVVNQILGTPGHLSGRTLASGDQVGEVWTKDDNHTRKPTGMACVGSTLYLAVQDLASNFDDAPAASISRSDDGGKTWTWDPSGPMFDDGVFTTIMFLDYGEGYSLAPDSYVCAYGLDGNWRASYTHAVDDPVDLYLARVPRDAVQKRSAWQFFTGTGSDGTPRWSSDITKRTAVLHDPRRLYTDSTGPLRGLTVISQGGVAYDEPIGLYLYTSWTEYTFEFYSATHPWGPWKLFASGDFGQYPWTLTSYGGYATTIPSKFISADGTSMWVQSNVCPCANAGVSIYDFSLRTMTLHVGDGTP